MLYISNAFSLSMLQTPSGTIRFKQIGLEEVKTLLEHKFESAVGHQSTADLLSQLLEVDIPMNRIQLKLGSGDILIIAQFLTRLPEGKILGFEEAKALYENGQLVFFLIKIE